MCLLNFPGYLIRLASADAQHCPKHGIICNRDPCLIRQNILILVIIQKQIIKESFCFFLIFFSEKSEKFILRTGRKLCCCFRNRCLIKRRQKGTCGEKEAALQGNNSRSIGLISFGNACNSISGLRCRIWCSGNTDYRKILQCFFERQLQERNQTKSKPYTVHAFLQKYNLYGRFLKIPGLTETWRLLLKEETPPRYQS